MSATIPKKADDDNRDRDRALVPAVMTIGLIALLGLGVVGMGLLFLYVSKDLALMLAIVLAAGILASISMAASRDSLDGPQKLVVALPAIVPLVLGGIFALTSVSDEDRNINRAPISVFPVESAVLVEAFNQEEFETGDLVLPASEDPNSPVQVGIRFNNEHAGVQHNVWVGTEVASGGAETNVFEGALISGVEQIDYAFDAPEASDDYVYWCSVHPNMQGNVSFQLDAEPQPAVEG